MSRASAQRTRGCPQPKSTRTYVHGPADGVLVTACSGETSPVRALLCRAVLALGTARAEAAMLLFANQRRLVHLIELSDVELNYSHHVPLQTGGER